MSANPKHGERKHAPFSPSAAERWIACPASVQLSKPAPESPPTKYTQAGEAMHEEAERQLRGSAPTKGPLTYELGGKTYEIPEEEWQPHVNNYVRFCIAPLYEGGFENRIEEKVMLVPELCYGTPDFVAIKGSTLAVVDLKTGSGKVVYARENAQLMIYAAAILQARPEIDKVELIICQLQHHEGLDMWVTDRKTIEDFKRKAVYAIAESCALDERQQSIPTAENIGEHCRWCPRHASCPAHRHQTDLALERMVLSDYDATTIPDDALGELVSKAPAIKKFLAAAEKEARVRMTHGSYLPGLKMVAGRRTRTYKSSMTQEELAAELQARGLEDPWDRKVKAMTAVEKALGKGRIDDLLEAKEGGPLLVPESDRRKAIDLNDEALTAMLANDDEDNEDG